MTEISDTREGDGIGTHIGDPDYAQAIVNTVRDSLLVMDGDFIVQDANKTFYQKFEVSAEETIGRPLRELGNGQWDIPALRQLLEDALPRQNPVTGFEVEHEFEHIGRRVMLVNATGLPYDKPPDLILLAITDVTAERQARSELEQAHQTLEVRVAERTAESERRTRQLQALAAALTDAEHAERRRIADLLHDHLQQLLVAVRMKVEQCRQQAAEPEATKRLKDAEVLVDECIASSRTLTVELCPPVLYHGGLGPALEWLGRHLHERYGLEVQVELVPIPDGLLDAWRALLYHATKELLFNVIKHAGTMRATLSVTTSTDTLQIVVEDDGVGYDPKTVRSTNSASTNSGFGLFNIQQRVESIGGRMEICEAGAAGCRVSLTIPMTPLVE